MTKEMSAGIYYIGDLLYVMKATWNEVCSVFNGVDDVYTLPSGVEFYCARTMYGNGSFPVYTKDELLQEVPVDSASVGCIKLVDVGQFSPDIAESSIIHRIDEPFIPRSEDGYIHIGPLTVDTGLTGPYCDMVDG